MSDQQNHLDVQTSGIGRSHIGVYFSEMTCKMNHITALRIGVIASLYCVLWLTLQSSAAEPERKALMPKQHSALFRAHCYECHASESEEAGVNLETISYDVAASVENAELWRKILGAINSGEMPPKDSKSLSAPDKTAFLEDLTAQMVIARKILGDTGGVIPLRRLNRREYANTIDDLLGIQPDVTSLPDDQVGAGFDTQGGSLFFSSDQLENYLATANASLRLCLLPRGAPQAETTRVEPEDTFNVQYRDYLAEIKDTHDRGIAWQNQTEKPPSEFGILDEYSVKKKIGAYKDYSPQLEWYLARPESKTGVISITTIKSGGVTRIKLPKLAVNAPGKYTVRFRAAHYPEADERFHYVELSSTATGERRHIAWRKVTATLDAPEVMSFEYEHLPGESRQLSLSSRTHQDRGDKNLWAIHRRDNGLGTIPGLWIDWVEVTGPEPYQAPSEAAKRILLDRPDGMDDDRYALEVIRRFAIRAFRSRPPQPDYLKQLFEHYQADRQSGMSLTEALINPLAIVLSSPEFLYMVESGRPDNTGRLTDSELAVRLSYLLWSSQPDMELMDLATGSRLSDPAVLREQADRLLSDPRHDRFVHDFVHQWLQMDRLGMFQFDGVQYPTFDNAVRENAREEVFQTFKLVMNESLPIGTLLNSDFVVINDLLAGYYGLPQVDGSEFRRVKVPANSPRGGLLGTAAVMAMGSDGIRTSPVERGAWVLRHLLHDPPAPAPPNVPQLSRLDGEVLSARELQKAHQEQPQCAQCHRKIDPIGYGLENFSADGLWREIESIGTGNKRNGRFIKTVDFQIDPSGQLPSGESFKDYFELRKTVGRYEDDFARGFAEALIEYGLGRPYEFGDQSLVEQILEAAKQDGYAVRSFVHALIQSQTFQSR